MRTKAVIRPAGPPDTAAICALLAAVFPGNPKADPALLAWQYWDNPYGCADAWVAEEDGRVLSHYAVMRVPGVLDGAPVVLGKGVDAATLPAARGRGLLTGVAAAALPAALACVPLVLTMPNDRSRAALARAGLAPLPDVTPRVRVLDDAWFAARTHLPRPFRALVFGALPAGGAEEAGAPPAGLDALWARTGGSWAVGGGGAWWQWRYAGRPGRAYRFWAARRGGRLVAAAVTGVRVVREAPFLHVLELLAEDRRAAGAVLGAALAAPGPVVGATVLGAAPGFRALPRGAGRVHLGAAAGPGVPDPRHLPLRLTWGLQDYL